MTTNARQHTSGEDTHQLNWFKASYSNGAGGECLECAVESSHSVLVRDSKCTDGAVIPFGSRPWAHFLLSLRDPAPHAPRAQP
ncbi:DUF397 domain-containing protein [Streptomyces sp. NPDC102360]|uniref:DUF397 domain-containing protein n=1 Tax=Streptomyces sp. NPDC102360 TaxID=3366160 RepID=UPI0037F49FD5